MTFSNIFNWKKIYDPDLKPIIPNGFHPRHVIKEEDLNDGEMICPKCNGVGFLNKIEFDDSSIYKDLCDKCQGTGKLDWIENIRGKKPNMYNSSSSGMLWSTSGWSDVSLSNPLKGTSGTINIDLRNEMIKDMAEQAAKKIDEEILEILTKGG